MKGLAEAKAEMLKAKTREQLLETTTDFCFAGRFTVSDELSYAENAELATRQSKNGVAELLMFAEKIEVRL